jgi:hypothetical protein
MPAPTIAGVGIGSVLETVTAQGVQNFVLDSLNCGWKIGDEVMGIGIEGDHGGVGEKACDLIFGSVGIENLVINPGQMILPKTADGLGRPQNGPPDAGFIEPDERAVPFLDLNDAVLDSHVRSIESGTKKLRKFSFLYLSKRLPFDTVTLC